MTYAIRIVLRGAWSSRKIGTNALGRHQRSLPDVYSRMINFTQPGYGVMQRSGAKGTYLRGLSQS